MKPLSIINRRVWTQKMKNYHYLVHKLSVTVPSLQYKPQWKMGYGARTVSTFIHLNNQLDRARGTLWISFIKNCSLPHQIKSFGPKKKNNCMHGLKSAILAFSQNWLIGWIGLALLVQPSISAHRKWPEIVVLASTNQVWAKLPSEASLVLCHSDPDPSSVRRLLFVTRKWHHISTHLPSFAWQVKYA